MSIGTLMGEDCPYEDDAIVSVAGIVQAVKMKTTRNNSMMAYVTVEDDTSSIEMIAFSNTLNQYGGYLRENSAVVVTGRLSVRDEKEPQIVINRVRPISDFAEQSGGNVFSGTLYIRLPSEESELYPKVRNIVNGYAGNSTVKVFFTDTQKMRGTQAELHEAMLRQLENLLGKENVVLK